MNNKKIVGTIDLNNISRNIPYKDIEVFFARLGLKVMGLRKANLNLLVLYKEGEK